MRKLRLHYALPFIRRVLQVSDSCYYAWQDRPLAQRDWEELRLELEIKAAHKRTRQTYGAEQLQRDLADHGARVGISIKKGKKIYLKGTTADREPIWLN
jgi:putative transposase